MTPGNVLYLGACRYRFRSGERKHLVAALRRCIEDGIDPLPDWVMTGITKQVGGHIASQPARIKWRTQTGTMSERTAHRICQVYVAVEREKEKGRWERGKAWGLTQATLERAGESLGMSWRNALTLYKEAQSAFD
jgi:hypothetical protein